MRFNDPQISVWLWSIPVLVLFLIHSARKRHRDLTGFADRNLIPLLTGSYNRNKLRSKNALLVAAFFLVVISLMRPQWGFRWREVEQRGINILVALDTSRSMLAEDVLPNRLERAKLAIRDFLKKLHGDRIGLVVFAGRAFLQCPLTLDYDGFLLVLDDVGVTSVPVGGTSLASAINTAIDSYEDIVQEEKILVVITDGEDLEGGVDQAVKNASGSNVRIFCVGMGSTEGELIPVPGGQGETRFVKDPEGDYVRTRLDEEMLQSIALRTNGMYVKTSGAEFGLNLIYREELADIQKQKFQSKRKKHYTERFQIPLVISIILLGMEALIMARRSDGGARRPG